MIDEKIRTFGECLEIANQCKNKKGNFTKKHLLLGNGFSMDIFEDIFNYKALAQNVGSPQVKTLFELLGTSDFEHVMRMLTTALKVVKAYPNSNPIATQIESHLDEIRKGLIRAISKSHPPYPSEITDEQYESCRLFLANFKNGKKYTFNYDLLLYWVYMHFLEEEEEEEKKKNQFNDGFRHPTGDNSIVTWEIGREHHQTVYYLHGAMHIFNDGAEVEKFTWKNTGVNISDQVRESINNGKYPVFISEGTTQQKLARIYSSSYLGRSFSSLKGISGNLFIFGHSLGKQDNHVFDYINSNGKLINIFISIFSKTKPADKKIIIDKVKRWAVENPTKTYYLYCSESANVWGNQANP